MLQLMLNQDSIAMASQNSISNKHFKLIASSIKKAKLWETFFLDEFSLNNNPAAA